MVDREVRELLGGLSASTFLRRHWQKRPLLVRGAIPGFESLLTRAELFALAGRDDVESRVIIRSRGRWKLRRGPFDPADLSRLPARGWTLLVQGVNLHVAAADALLRRFAFIPFARLDDVMVSYAAPGSGVGPHIDSYDVFLLQGEGRRRWQIGRASDERDRSIDASLPVKILTRFHPEEEHTLDAGDMLYLPPGYAHDGVAVGACSTYSIGFRAPSAQELATAFLDWLRDSIGLEGRYSDPLLSAATEPARIGIAMRKRCSAMLGDIRWSDALVARFLGCYLSDPKPNIFFEPPSRPMAHTAFRAASIRLGVRLDPRTQLLYDDSHVFLNGVAVDVASREAVLIRRLANERCLGGATLRAEKLNRAAATMLHRWYLDGFLHLD
jgi:50S ribosomal protein L16 3-hydroxylase